MENKRENGYYWVKYDGKWVIAEYYAPNFPLTWGMCNSEENFFDEEFEEISENRITHD